MDTTNTSRKRKRLRNRRIWTFRLLLGVIFTLCLALLYVWMLLQQARDDVTRLLSEKQSFDTRLRAVEEIFTESVGKPGNDSAPSHSHLSKAEISFLLRYPRELQQKVSRHGIHLYRPTFPWLRLPLPDGYIAVASGEFGGPRSHKGLDIVPSSSLEVESASDGMVVDLSSNPFLLGGRYIIIETVVAGIKYHIYYGHLETVEVQRGQLVQQGQRIALAGSSGTWCVGRHLHFEIRRGSHVLNPVATTTFFRVIERELRR